MRRASRPGAGRLRAAGIVAHRWLGLTAGLVFLVLGVTGSIVAFGPEILAWQQPALAGPAPAGWAQHRADILERTLGAHPRGHVELVRFPGGPLGVYEIYLADETQEYRDAATGQVLHVRQAWGDWLMISREIHTHLGGGETGELLLGWLGVALLVLLVTGAWLWWPRPGAWRSALRYPSGRTALPVLYWWHKTVGFATFALLGFVTLTGVAMVFYGASQALLTGVLGGNPPSLPTRVAPATEIRWPELLSRLDATLPDGRTVFFYPPSGEEEPLVFRKKLPGELHPNGRSFVLLDGRGGLAAAHDASAAEAGLRATNAIYPLHAGRTGAGWWQWTVAATGLLPVVLFATGFLVWRRRVPGASGSADPRQ